jgi:arylsulfatase A
MGYGDPRCYNPESDVPTPNIDRLAERGRRFTDCHSPSAVCTPTRYGVLTGRYCWRTDLKFGVGWGESPLLVDPERETVAKLLQRNGYHTACVGKWHLGLGGGKKTDYTQPLTPGPNECGFDYFFGIPASLDMAPYCYVENDRPLEPMTDYTPGSEHNEGGFWREGPKSPGFDFDDVLPTLTDRAVSYIGERAKAENPFYLYLPLTAPHTPWLPVEPYRGATEAGDYGDFAHQVDAAVGQVLDAIDAAGVADNTVVVFTSDNGAHATLIPEPFTHEPNHPLRGQKADVLEGGHRIPFVVRWPGQVPAGTTGDGLMCLTDWYATCAALIGANGPDGGGPDSFNQLPAWLGESHDEPLRPFAIHHSSMGVFAVRQGPWKYIDALGHGGFGWHPAKFKPEPGGPTGQLYNLDDDPKEENDLFEAMPEKVAKMQALLKRAQDAEGIRDLN